MPFKSSNLPSVVDSPSSSNSRAVFSRENLPDNPNAIPNYLKVFGGKGTELSGEYLDKFNFTTKVGADNEELRAQRQGFWEKAGNGAVKFLGRTATTVAELPADLFIGIPLWATTGEFKNFYDNDATRKLDAFNDYLKEKYPNYYTQAEQDMNLFQSLGTANFWFDKVGNGLGFTTGAVLGGLGVGAALKGGRALLFNGLKNALRQPYIAGRSAIAGINLANAETATLGAYDAFTEFTILGASASAEAGIEAREGTKTFINSQIEEFKRTNLRNPNERELSEITRLGEALGNTQFAMNLPIIAGSNFIQFGNTLLRGVKKDAINNVTRTAKGYKVTEKTLRDKVYGILKNPVSEFSQEEFQYTVEKGLQDYYEKYYNNKDISKVSEFLSSMGYGMTEAFTTKEGLEQGLIGFIVGALGAPSVGGKYGVNLAGGVYEYFREQGYDDAKAKMATAHLNSIVADDVFQVYIKSAINTTRTQEEFKKAAEKGDIFAYKNAQWENLTDLVANRAQFGRTRDLLNDLDTFKKISIDDFQQQFGSVDNQIFDEKDRDKFIDNLKESVLKLDNIYQSTQELMKGHSDVIKGAAYNAAATAYYSEKRETAIHDELSDLTNGQFDFTFPSMTGIDKFDLLFEDGKVKVKEKEGETYHYEGEAFNNWLKQRRVSQEKLDKIDELATDLPKLIAQREFYNKLYEELTDPTASKTITSIYNEIEENNKKAFEEARKEKEQEDENIRRNNLEKEILAKAEKGELTNKDLDKLIKNSPKDADIINKYRDRVKVEQERKEKVEKEEKVKEVTKKKEREPQYIPTDEDLKGIEGDEKEYAKSHFKSHALIQKYINDNDTERLDSYISATLKSLGYTKEPDKNDPKYRYLKSLQAKHLNIEEVENVEDTSSFEEEGTIDNPVPNTFKRDIFTDTDTDQTPTSNNAGNGINIYIHDLVKVLKDSYKGNKIKLTKKQSEVLRTLMDKVDKDVEVVLSVDTLNDDYKERGDTDVKEWIKDAPIKISVKGTDIGFLNKTSYLDNEIALVDELLSNKNKLVKFKDEVGRLKEGNLSINEYSDLLKSVLKNKNANPNHLYQLLSYGDYNTDSELAFSLEKWKETITNDLQGSSIIRDELAYNLKEGKEDNVKVNVRNITSGSIAQARKYNDNNTYEVVVSPLNKSYETPNYRIVILNPADATRLILVDPRTKSEIKIAPTDSEGYRHGVEYFIVEDTANNDVIPVPLYRATLEENRDVHKFAYKTIGNIVRRLKETNEVGDAELNRLRDELNEVIALNNNADDKNLLFKVFPTEGTIRFRSGNDVYTIFTRTKDGKIRPNWGLSKDGTGTIEELEKGVTLQKALASMPRNVNYKNFKLNSYTDPVTQKKYTGEDAYMQYLHENGVLKSDIADVVDHTGKKIGNVVVKGVRPLVVTLDSMTRSDVKPSPVSEENTEDTTPKSIKTKGKDLGDNLLMMAEDKASAYNEAKIKFDKTIHKDSIKHTITSKDYIIREKVRDNFKTPSGIALFDTLLSYTDFEVHILDSLDYFRTKKSDGSYSLAFYDADNNSIQINGPVVFSNSKQAKRLYELIIPHEIVHRGTAASLYSGKVLAERIEKGIIKLTSLTVGEKLAYNFYKDVKSIYDRSLKASNNKDQYGFTDEDEFLAEALSNRTFSNHLETLYIDNNYEKGNFFTELLKSIIKFVQRLLRLENKNDINPITAYEELEELLNKYQAEIVPYNETVLGDYHGSFDIFVDKENEQSNFNSREEAHAVNVLASLITQAESLIANETAQSKITVKAEDGSHKYSLEKIVLRGLNNHLTKLKEGKGNERKIDLVSRIINDISRDNSDIWNKAKDYITYQLGFKIQDTFSTVEDFTISTSNKVGNNVRTMIFTSPRMIYDNNGDIIPDRGTLTGIVEFLDFHTVYNNFKAKLSSSVSVTDMMNRIQDMVQSDPSLVRIYNILETNEDHIQEEFFSQMKMQSIDSMHIRFTEDGDKIKPKVRKSNRKPHFEFSNNWIDTISRNISSKYYSKNQINNISVYINNALRSKDIPTKVENINKAFNSIGIVVPKYIIASEAARVTDNQKSEHLNNVFVKPLNNVLDFSIKKGKFTSHGVINSVAEVMSKYLVAKTENTYNAVDGNMEQSVRVPNFFSAKKDLITGYLESNKEAEDMLLSWLRNVAKDPSHTFSNWLWNDSTIGMLNMVDGHNPNAATLNRAFFENFMVEATDGLKNEVTKLGFKYKGMTDEDWSLFSVLSYIEGSDKKHNRVYIPVMPLSDSNTSYVLNLKPIRIERNDIDTSLYLNPNSKLFKAVKNTVLQEIVRMKQAKRFIFKHDTNGVIVLDKEGNPVVNSENLNSLQQYYHFKNRDAEGRPVVYENGKVTGNVFKFHNLPQLNTLLSDSFAYGMIDTKVTTTGEDVLNTAIQSTMANMIKEIGTTLLPLKNKIDGTYPHIVTSSPKGKFSYFVTEYTINHYIANVETQNFFSGVTSEYKSGEDTNKRMKGIGSPGLISSMINLGRTRSVAVLSDYIIPSMVYDEMVKTLTPIIKKLKGLSTNAKAKVEAERILQGYKTLNTTDGQGYLSWETYKNLIKDFGKYKEFKTIIEKIDSGKNLTLQEIETVTRPIKMFMYDRVYDEETNRMMSVQFKYSVLPLIDALTKGTQLELLKDVADEIVYESGIKVGITSITNPIVDGKLSKEKLNQIVPRTVPNDNWRLQQETPVEHEDHSNKFGVQISKSIFSNIPQNAKYKIGGKEVTGKELFDEYQQLNVDKIKVASDDTSRQLGAYEGIEKDSRTFFGINELADYLHKEGVRRNVNNNVLKGLEKLDHTRFKVPLSFGIYKKKALSLLTSPFSKNVTDIKMPGFHAVLGSNAFFYNVEKSNQLKSYKNEDGAWVLQAAVAPWDSRFYNPNGTPIPIESIDKELRTFIGYRIPYSGKHSSAIIEVVKWLPKEIGPTIIVTDDIIERMGSDFDIDSLYTIVKSFTRNGVGNLVPYQYKSEGNNYQEWLEHFMETQEGREYSRNMYDNLSYWYERLESIRKGRAISRGKFQAKIDEFTSKWKEVGDLIGISKEEFQTLNDEYAVKKLELLEEIKQIEAEIKFITSDKEFDQEQNTIVEMFKVLYNGKDYNEVLLEAKNELEKYEKDFESRYNALLDRYINDISIVSGNTIADKIASRKLADYHKALGNLRKEEIDKYKERQAQYQKEIDDVYAYIEDDKKFYKKIPKNRYDSLPVNEKIIPASRDNRILDIMISILSNPIHQKEVLEPAAFPNTERYASEINSITNELSNLNPVNPNDAFKLRSRALKGKRGIELYASLGGTLSVLQSVRAKTNLPVTIKYSLKDLGITQSALEKKYTDVRVQGDDVYISYDKFGYTNDGGFTDVSGEYITFKVGEFIDAFADAVKNPPPPYINSFTSNAHGFISVLSGDTEFATYLVNQPAIRELVDYYLNNNGLTNNVSTGGAINHAKRIYYARAYTAGVKEGVFDEVLDLTEKVEKYGNLFLDDTEVNKYFGIDKDTDYFYSTSELKEFMKFKYKQPSTVTSRYQYYIDQIKLISMFAKYNARGEELLKLSQTLRTDKAGAGPDFSKTDSIERTIVENSVSKFVTVDDVPLTKAIFPSVLGLSEKSVYPSLEAYFTYSNLRAKELLRDFFPSEREDYYATFSEVIGELDPNKTSAIDSIKNKFDIFVNKLLLEDNPNLQISLEDEKRILGLESNNELLANDNLSIDEFNQLSTYDKLVYLKRNSDIVADEKHILNYLELDDESKDIKYIKFIDPRNSYIENILIESFASFFTKGEFENSFATDLIKLSILSNGLSDSMNSIAKVIPVDTLIDNFQLSEYLYKSYDTRLSKDDNGVLNRLTVKRFLQNNPDLLMTARTQSYVDSKGETRIKKGRARWIVNKDGLVVIKESQLKREDPALQSKTFLKVLTPSAVAKNGFVIVEKVSETENETTYAPIETLGAWNLIENRSKSLLSKNHNNITISDYTDGLRTVYQGYNTLEDRKYNYFTLNKEEAKDYGSKIRELEINTEGFLRSTPNDNGDYYNLINEFSIESNKRFDILDNSQDGLKNQELFFSFLEQRGYKGLIIEGWDDSNYVVTFNTTQSIDFNDPSLEEQAKERKKNCK